MSNLFKSSILISLSELAFNFSGYVTQALIGRMFTPAEYGRFSIIVTFATMIIVLIGRGIPISTSKHLSEINRKDFNGRYAIKKAALTIQILIIAVISFAYFMLASVFANILKDPSLTPLFQISSLIIPTFALASFYAYYFTGIQDFKRSSTLKFLRSIFKIICIVGLGYFFKLTGAIIGQALAPLLVFLSGYLMDPFNKFKLKKRKDFKNAPVNIALMKKLSIFAGPIVIFMLFYEFMLSMNLYFVKALLGQDDLVGIYSAASTVSRIPYYLFFFMTIILLPKISELITNKEHNKTKELLEKAFKYLFITLVPMTVLLSLFSESAVRFFYGSRYTSAGSIMSILIFGFAFLTVFYIITFVLNGAGKNKFPVWASIIGTILNGILNWILLKRMGLPGSAIATTITAFVIMIWALIYSNQKITHFINIWSIIKYLLTGLFIYLLGSLFFSQGRFIFILWSFLLLIIYFFIMILFKELKIDDWKYLVKSFKK